MLNVVNNKPQDIDKNLWNSIEKVLIEREMSIYRLAKITGIPRTQIYALKRGYQKSFSWGYMVRIADALDVSLDIFR